MPNNNRVLIVVENNTVPGDFRVWCEATSLRDAGWHVSVVCPAANGPYAGCDESPTENPLNIQGISVYRFPLRFAERGVLSYFREYITALISISRLSWRVWREHRFDIIHICNPPDAFFPIAFFYKFLGVRIIFDHHDLFPETVELFYRGRRGRLLYMFARVTEYLTFRSADLVISTNQSYRRVALERGDVPPERVVVVRNGPKIAQFVPVDAIPALKLGFPNMVCYVGIMGYQDGISELIDAIRYIVHELRRRDILFTLLGDGAARSQAQADIRRYGLEQFVTMPGFIRDNLLLRQYICTADLCLSPEPPTRLNSSSTLIKIGEYMAAGRAIVAFDLEETRFTAQDSAVYVPSGSIEIYARTTVSLIDDPARRARMGESGRQRVLNVLGWEHQEQEFLRAYARCLQS